MQARSMPGDISLEHCNADNFIITNFPKDLLKASNLSFWTLPRSIPPQRNSLKKEGLGGGEWGALWHPWPLASLRPEPARSCGCFLLRACTRQGPGSPVGPPLAPHSRGADGEEAHCLQLDMAVDPRLPRPPCQQHRATFPIMAENS